MDTNRKGIHQKRGGIRRYIKILATFIIVLIGLTALSSNNQVSAQTQTATGVHGSVRWTVYSDGLLEFKPNKGSSGTLANISTTTSTRPWASYKNSVTKIKFQSGVRSSTHLFDMFNGMNRVTTIDFGNFNTSSATSMGQMFWGMTSLTRLDLRGFDTRNVTNMGKMFGEASSLTTLDLSNFNTSKVTNMTSMFYNTSSLTTLDLSNFNTSKVTNMHTMFYNTGRLTKLDLSNFDTSKVTDMQSMFWGASSLTTLDLSSFNTSNVTTMRSMFSGASSLTTLDLRNFDTSKVTDMAYMFYDTSSLTKLDVSKFNTSNVTTMYTMFYNASSLTKLDVSNFDTSKVTNMGAMFYTTSSLTTLDLSNFNTSKVTNMSMMFYHVRSLTTLDVSNFDTSKVTNMKSMFNTTSSLTTLDLSNFDTRNVTDMEWMFYDAGSLTTLDISNFNTSKVTTMNGIFTELANLKSINLSPNFQFKTGHGFVTKPQGTTSDGYIYTGNWEHSTSNKVYSATNLANNYTSTSAGLWEAETNKPKSTISGLHGGVIWEILEDNTLNFRPRNGVHGVMWSVHSIESTRPWVEYKDVVTKVTFEDGVQANRNLSYMFDGMNKVTTIDIGNFDTSDVTNMRNMFSSTSSLTTLDLSNFNTSNVTNMEAMFENASNLTTLDISNFDTSNVIYMSGMFFNASSLTTLDVSSFDTSKVITMLGMFNNASSLTTLDVSNFNTSNVISMRYMFKSTSSLTTLDLSNFDTSNVTDMTGMFEYTNSLTTLDVSSFNTSNVTNMSWMFRGASSLTTLDVSNFNTSKVTNMRTMFSATSSLTTLDLSNFDTSKVTNMGTMFDDASSLTTLDLSNFDTSKVTDMYAMFYSTRSLTTLDLSNFNTSKVTNMSVMFGNTDSLTTLDVSNFDTSNVTNMSRMFDNASSLTKLDLSSFNTSKVTNMGTMFRGASSLTKLDLSSFNTGQVTTMDNMIRGASRLEELDISNFNTAKVSAMSSMFNNLPQLKRIHLGTNFTFKDNHDFTTAPSGTNPDGYEYTGNWIHEKDLSRTHNSDKTVYTASELSNVYNNSMSGWWHADTDFEDTRLDWGYLDGVIWEILEDNTLNFRPRNGVHGVMWNVYSLESTRPWIAYKDVVTKVTFEDGVQAATSISSMFKDMHKVQSINFGNFNTSNVTDMFSMFRGASSLTTLDVSNFDTSNVIDMSSMFRGASSLTTLDLSNFNTSNVTNMSYMFYGTSSLTTLDVSNFNTSNVTNMSGMFSGSSSLTTLDLSNFNTSNVTTMMQMFYSTNSLTTLDVSSFNTSNVTNMYGMFYNARSLTTLDVSNFDTSKVTDMSRMFRDTRSLTTLDVINFNTSNVTDMSYMFSGASSLTTLVVSNFDTSNVTDMESMFRDTSSLTTLDVSNFNTSKVTNMRYMFYNTRSLTTLDVSNFDTSNVTNMYGMFRDASSLTTLDVSNFNTSNVTDMESMFRNTISLTTLDISNFNTTNVSNMTSMFYNLPQLKQIHLGTNFRFKGNTAFNTVPSGKAADGRDYTGRWAHQNGLTHSSNPSKKGLTGPELAGIYDNTVAGWWIAETLAEYTVNFNSQGGSNVSSVVVVEGGTIAVPGSNRLINVPIYHRDDGVYRRDTNGNKVVSHTEQRRFYVLEGWYTQPNGQGEKLTADTVITSDLTYHANWQAVPITYQDKDQTKYTYVDFTYNGGLVTGLSDSGLAKFTNGDRLYLPDYNPDTGQQIIEIGAEAFRHIRFDGELNLPYVEIIGSRAFERASGSANGLRGNLQLLNVRTIGTHAFFNQLFTEQLVALHTEDIGAYAFGNVAFKEIYLQRVQSLGTQVFSNLSNAKIVVHDNNRALFNSSKFGASSVNNLVHQEHAGYVSDNVTRFLMNPIEVTAELRDDEDGQSLGENVTIQTTHALHNYFERDRKPYQFKAPVIPGYTPVIVDISTNTQVTPVYYTQNTVTEQETVMTPFKTKYVVVVDDPLLPVGQQREKVAGIEGKQVIEREWVELPDGTKGDLLRETVLEDIKVRDRVVEIHPTYTEVSIEPSAPIRVDNPHIETGEEIVRREPQPGIRRDYLLPDGNIYTIVVQQPVRGIIEIGTKPKDEVRNVEYTVEEIIPYETRVIESPHYDIFFRQVTTHGVNGRKYVVYLQEYVNGVKNGNPVYVRESVIEEPITEIITQGTKVSIGF